MLCERRGLSTLIYPKVKLWPKRTIIGGEEVFKTTDCVVSSLGFVLMNGDGGSGSAVLMISYTRLACSAQRVLRENQISKFKKRIRMMR